MKTNKAPEPKPTRWEVVYEDEDIKSTWKYNTNITTFGPVEVSEVYKRDPNKVPKKRGRKPKIKSVILIALLGISSLIGCTENQSSRKYGGKSTISLESGERLVNITWKEDDLWILTRQDTSVWPKTYKFSEKSNLGILEGEILIVEK